MHHTLSHLLLEGGIVPWVRASLACPQHGAPMRPLEDYGTYTSEHGSGKPRKWLAQEVSCGLPEGASYDPKTPTSPGCIIQEFTPRQDGTTPCGFRS